MCTLINGICDVDVKCSRNSSRKVAALFVGRSRGGDGKKSFRVEKFNKRGNERNVQCEYAGSK